MKQAEILIVDDQPMFRQGLRACLEKRGFAVAGEAETPAGAMEQLFQTEPDLVIMAVRLVGGSGIAACREMRLLKPRLRVLLMSAHHPEEDELMQTQALLAGASGYLSKRLTDDEWHEAVVQILRGRLLFPNEVVWKVKEKEALTGRELEVLRLLARGWDNRRIAETLVISERTVRFHLGNIYEKIGVQSRTEAAIWAVRRGVGGEE